MGVAGSTGGGPSAGSGGAPLGGAAGSAGHGGRAPSPLGGAAGGGAEGGGDGGAGGDSGSIWTPDSDSIDIQWFAYFRGGYHFTRQRDQLSPQQLELAQAIKVVPSSNACAADYIELMRNYNAFIITDIPGMNHKSRDWARRFITFIDSVYESRVRGPGAIKPHADTREIIRANARHAG